MSCYFWYYKPCILTDPFTLKSLKSYFPLLSFNDVISGMMERRSRNSQSSIDIRSVEYSPTSAADTSLPPPVATNRRRKFFASFRKKIRAGKYKDKNSNIETLSASQPNIYRSVYHSATLSTDEDSEMGDMNTRSLDKSLSYQDMLPGRSRSRSQRSGSRSDQEASLKMSRSNEDEEVDSGIAVIDTSINTQVRN